MRNIRPEHEIFDTKRRRPPNAAPHVLGEALRRMRMPQQAFGGEAARLRRITWILRGGIKTVIRGSEKI